MPWKVKRTVAQKRRAIMKFSRLTPKSLKFRKNTVTMRIDGVKIKYPVRFYEHVRTIGNWAHSRKNSYLKIDRDVKRKNLKPLLVHESTEQYLQKRKGLNYRQAHWVATQVEKAYVLSRGKKWKSYQNSVLRTKT